MANFFPISQDTEDPKGEQDESGGGSFPVMPQVAGEYIAKVEAFVKDALRKARKQGVGRNDYKDGLVYQERREILNAFFMIGGRSWLRRCARCTAWAVSCLKTNPCS